MTYQTIDFDDHEIYVGNRPRTAITLRGPGGWYGATWQAAAALVDTGADFMLLPEQAATGVGITPAGAQTVRVATAGGVVTVWRKLVSVTVLNITVDVPISFCANARPLLGRQAIFQLMQTAGFGTTEQLQEWYATPGAAAFATIAAGAPVPAMTAKTIVDHGSWVEIGGVRVDKRRTS